MTPAAQERALHTPGPWWLAENGCTILCGASHDPDIVATVESDDPMAISNRPDYAHESEANAHVITATPVLLAACQALVAVYERVGGPLRVDPAVAEARAAIAQAKGEKP